jgi:4-hydroxy-tetrahydrodipicolinate reductase
MLAIALAGATGWTGSAVAAGAVAADDLELRAAIARRAAGRDLGTALGEAPWGVPVYASVAEALDGAADAGGVDVLVDYTSHESIKGNTLAAIERGVGVVVGASGLSAADYADIDAAARAHHVGVIAAGNFSLTAAMATAAAMLVARHLPECEILDFATADKRDAPSGTSREIAERLAEVRAPVVGRPVLDTDGLKEARGGTVAGSQIHSIRLPSFALSTEVIFALPDERLTIRHDAGSSAAPYVAGTLIAARAIPGRVGLTRGLDTLLLEG